MVGGRPDLHTGYMDVGVEFGLGKDVDGQQSNQPHREGGNVIVGPVLEEIRLDRVEVTPCDASELS